MISKVHSVKDIYVFTSVNDAIQRLRDHAHGFSILNRKTLESPDDIIAGSVSSNIYRALQTPKPSVIYTTWAKKNINAIWNELKKCVEEKEYDSIIQKYSHGLLHSWLSKSGVKLGYGPASKIVNLLIKIMQESSVYSLEHIIPLQHVPWDSYTLRPLRLIVDELIGSDFPAKIVIPSDASMSFVNTVELYQLLQQAVANLYRGIDPVSALPAIYFEYYAWNTYH